MQHTQNKTIRHIKFKDQQDVKNRTLDFIKGSAFLLDFDLKGKQVYPGDIFSGLISFPDQAPQQYTGKVVFITQHGLNKGVGLQIYLNKKQEGIIHN